MTFAKQMSLNMKPSNIQPEEFAGFYATYINQVSSEYTLIEELEISVHRFVKFVQNIPLDKFDYRYAEGKWTPKEVLGHTIDTERIMTFRALCFARGEKQAMPGFDQDPYVLLGRFDQVATVNLLADFEAQRKALLTLIATLSEEALDQVGTASGNSITPRALFWIIPGHFIHHFSILKERY